jgi:molybdate transport system substrate-binding protein
VRRYAVSALSRNAHVEPSITPILRLAAAVSLQEAVGEILIEYALLRPQVRVHAVFGASNELAAQIAAGAPADVFLSGEIEHLHSIAQQRAIDRIPQRIAVNRLAGIALKTSPYEPDDPAKVLSASFQRLAIADRQTPLGGATSAFLERRLPRPLPADRLIEVDNARGILAALRSGRADLGIAFASDAAMSPDTRTLFQVAASKYRTIYHGAVIIAPEAKLALEAEALLQFFQSPTARRCLRRCGLRQ